jgi:hypothetical protein
MDVLDILNPDPDGLNYMMKYMNYWLLHVQGRKVV